MITRILCGIGLAALCAAAQAQLSVGSVPETFGAQRPDGYQAGVPKPELCDQIAPFVPAFRYELEETVKPAKWNGAVASEEGNLSLDIGYLREAQAGILEMAPWIELPNDKGWVKRVELRSKDATGLRVLMTSPDHAQLRVYDPASGVAWGPYANRPLDDDGKWWSTVIFGDTIGLEFWVPADMPPQMIRDLRITDVFYCYYPFSHLVEDHADTQGACHLDLMCFATRRDTVEARSIAVLFNTTGCTGAMLNRTGSDFAPILMTARHCINTQANANGIAVVFFWQATSCNGANPNFNTLPRNDGSLLLKTDFSSEWTLLGLYDPAGTNSYAGWTSGTVSNGTAVWGVSHPGLEAKRYHDGSKVGNSSCLGGSSHYFSWATGRIDPGSSGSPIFRNDNGQVVGTASCASDTNGDGTAGPCAPDGWYGRLDVAFAEIQYYIFNMANPTYVNRAVAGDAGNDGSSERGTNANPFNTVREGYYCVPAGGTVNIQVGNYNERFTLWRPMTLRNVGGVVRIGTP